MHIKTLILGGGPTGLSAAYHLQDEYLLIEKEPQIGGLCRSVEQDGFIFDYAGHIIFTNDEYVRTKLYPMLLGDNIHWQHREAWIYSKKVFTRYPFQASTYGLPPEVIKDCILGAVEASYTKNRVEPANFEEFILTNWGSGVAKHFMLPYNRKLWTIPLDQMSYSWLGGRVPAPSLEEVIEGALREQPKAMGPNVLFGYPIRGGFGAMMKGWSRYLDSDRIQLDVKVVAIDPVRSEVKLSSGTRISFDSLIVTSPLPATVQLLTSAPVPVRAAASRLRSVGVRCVNIGINRPDELGKHWVYYPEDTVFHRLFFQSNASIECVPKNCSSFTAEITYSPYKPLPCSGRALIDLVIKDAERVGVLKPGDRVLVANEVDIPYGYVIPEVTKDRDVDTIRAWLRTHGIFLAGRFAEWAYYNSDHAMLAGRHVAEQVSQSLPLRKSVRFGDDELATSDDQRRELPASSGESSQPLSNAHPSLGSSNGN